MTTAPNEPPPEGSSGPQSPSAPADGAQAVETPTNSAEGRTAAPGDPLRHALAVDAVGPVLNERGEWLPADVRRAVADAVLAAIEPVTEHCIHDHGIHHRHHNPRNPVIGCPWCDAGTRVEGIDTGDLT